MSVAGVSAALALTLWVPILRDRLTFFLFWPLIFVAAFVGGRGPGILTTVLSAVAVLFLMPANNRTTAGFLATVIAFVSSGAMAVFLALWREQAEEQLRAAAATANNALREAEVAARAKDAFLATISHELRTPLSPILAWVGMLRSGGLTPDQADRALEVIDRNVRIQAQLIEDLLDVSRIIEGKMRLETRNVAVAAVVQNAIETMRPAAQAKEIQLEMQLDDLPCTVAGDPDRLQQIVWNLLSNAVKFTPRGGCVRVSVQRADSCVEIVVADTGCGIAAELQPYLFDRFWQADVSADRIHGGLGLGLSIVRHLTELHGGTVHAGSDGDGRGSTFTIRLPLLPRARAEAGQDETDRPSVRQTDGFAAVSLVGLEILVVDDEPDSNEVIRLMLAGRGAEVRVAASAAHAMEQLLARVPDALVCDIGMPVEDGYSLIARIRAASEPLCRLPAIALTAYASVEDRIRLLSAGFQVHVAKPADPDELVAAVAVVTGPTLELDDEFSATGES